MKRQVKSLILGIMTAALTTSFFTGCQNTPNPSEFESHIDITDDIIPGIGDSGTDSFSIKYKYWYDNPDLAEAQAESLTNDGSPTGDTFLTTHPIYEDSKGNEYILSGRTKVYLSDGRIDSKSALLLRAENGDKIYSTTIADILAKLKDFPNQAQTFAERQTGEDLAGKETVEDGLTICVNNTTTDYTTSDNLINLASVFDIADYGYLDLAAYSSKAEANAAIYTAAGIVEINFSDMGPNIRVTYSTLADASYYSPSDVQLSADELLCTPEVLESIFGYDVEVYDDYVNIVTDNHDIFSSSTIFADPASSVAIVPGLDSTKPADDPDNQAAITDYEDTLNEALEIAEEKEKEEAKHEATPEQAAQQKEDNKKRQEAADNAKAYTTDGIPLTSEGSLTEPAKPTADYKLPANAQLEFKGDASTAARTTLPDGCYWTPMGDKYPNAFTDPAGNIWLNNDSTKIPFELRNEDEGYYDTKGWYHFSQFEIDEAARLTAASHDIHVNGPTDGAVSEEGQKALEDLLNSLL